MSIFPLIKIMLRYFHAKLIKTFLENVLTLKLYFIHSLLATTHVQSMRRCAVPEQYQLPKKSWREEVCPLDPGPHVKSLPVPATEKQAWSLRGLPLCLGFLCLDRIAWRHKVWFSSHPVLPLLSRSFAASQPVSCQPEFQPRWDVLSNLWKWKMIRSWEVRHQGNRHGSRSCKIEKNTDCWFTMQKDAMVRKHMKERPLCALV